MENNSYSAIGYRKMPDNRDVCVCLRAMCSVKRMREAPLANTRTQRKKDD